MALRSVMINTFIEYPLFSNAGSFFLSLVRSKHRLLFFFYWTVTFKGHICEIIIEVCVFSFTSCKLRFFFPPK